MLREYQIRTFSSVVFGRRPGSGCSTFLKVIPNQREELYAVKPHLCICKHFYLGVKYNTHKVTNIYSTNFALNHVQDTPMGDATTNIWGISGLGGENVSYVSSSFHHRDVFKSSLPLLSLGGF